MKTRHSFIPFVLFSMWLCGGATLRAQDPIIQTKYTADPAPMVYNDTVFLYTGHDEDDAYSFKMFDWQLYTSTDMVNWTDHGTVATTKTFPWREEQNGAWAMQVVERNGKFYMYCTVQGNGIGVLVSDSPYGPFKDPIGQPLVWQKGIGDDIDPTVFIDDDGLAYMYWGNPNLYYVKLNEDMISYSGGIVKIGKLETYQEGPWFYKRNGHYYLAFASTCCPEGIGYAMSGSPTGSWDLLFLYMKEHRERRSVSVAEMHYNPDGTIQEVPYFKDVKVEQIEHFNPYRRVEAETMAWGHGLKTARLDDGGIYVTAVDDGDSLVVRGVDFGKRGAKRFRACIASEQGCAVEIHLDSAGGPLVGTLEVKATGGMQTYKEMECRVKGAKGVHDLVFLFKGSVGKDLMNWDYWCFN